jgi:Mce-associated membrane protein
MALFTRRGPVRRTDSRSSAYHGTPVATLVEDRATGTPSDVLADDVRHETPCTDTDLTPDSRAGGQPAATTRGVRRYRQLLVFLVLPLIALAIAAGAGYLKWQAVSMQMARAAASDSIRAASDATVKMLSYRPDTAERDLGAARDLLTGNLRNDYTSLTNDVVIPGAKQKHISAVATVPAAASVSTTSDRAVVLVFVNQTVIVGSDPPASSTSSVRVTLQKQDDRWLVSAFDPI